MSPSRIGGDRPLPQAPITPTNNTNAATPSTRTNNNLSSGLRTDVNTWEVGSPRATELSPAVSKKAEDALSNYDQTLRRLLHHDAASLAAGHTPVRNGEQLSDTQRKELLSATKDMFMDMPIGALSPRMAGELKGYLDRQGVSTDNLETKTLKDLGDVGAELGKKWANDLKDSSPAAYYGLLATAGAAIGTYGYLQGSDALKKLGIKPEFKTKFFDDSISVKAEAMWDKRFRNPNLVADIGGSFKAGTLGLRANTHVDARNFSDNSHGSLGVRLGDDRNFIDGQVNADLKSGVTGYDISGRLTPNDSVSLYGAASLNKNLELNSGVLGGSFNINNKTSGTIDLHLNSDLRPSLLEASVAHQPNDRFSVRGSYSENLITHDRSVDLSAGYRPTKDLEFAVKGGYGSDTGARVGVGLTWRF
jgi:hypothetical protein